MKFDFLGAIESFLIFVPGKEENRIANEVELPSGYYLSMRTSPGDAARIPFTKVFTWPHYI